MVGPSTLSPLLEQYEGVKSRYPGHLVLFRVGDFYETFGEDAKLLSQELEVVLTARAPDSRGDRTPMAGVPHHSVDGYLGRLLRKGYKVAVCDQVEDARFAQGLVRREVTRVVTPGTVLEDQNLPGAEHNFLACLVWTPNTRGRFATVDITTGEWFRGEARDTTLAALLAELAAYNPREILVRAEQTTEAQVRQEYPTARIEKGPEPISLVELPPSLRGESSDVREFEADASLAGYVRSTQPRLLAFVQPSHASLTPALHLDGKTLRHLEIAQPMDPDDARGSTLLSTMDETVTSLGKRTLSFWLRHPLADVPSIIQRQELVELLRGRSVELEILRRALSQVSDISRIASRIAGRRVRPPELGALRSSLQAIEFARSWLLAGPPSTHANALAEALAPIEGLISRLESVLPDTLPAIADSGGLFRPGFSEELDGLALAERNGVDELDRLESRERERSGIRTLRVGYNQVFGYYFEVPRSQVSKVPSTFLRKQSLANSERFSTEELGTLEQRVLDARERRSDVEAGAWERFLTELEASIPALHRLARAVGELDALHSFARVAESRGYVRPEVDDGPALVIREGRHPILDRGLGQRFVPNDTELDADQGRMLVLTGPNMSGKSTYMRQVGLLVVLAQAGACVPARYCQVGKVGALFTRMGFTDSIGRGKSSFMVEMSEVSEILASAGHDSLVLLDEVGRGTSTFDGFALAWGVLKHLHDTSRCRTVLATHYHQLTQLAASLPGAHNAHLATREGPEGVVFLHRLVPGSTDRSLGIHVARLAGLPPDVLKEAERTLRGLEQQKLDLKPPGASRSVPTPRYTQGVLLDAVSPDVPAIVEALRTLDVDGMTPLEAIAWLAEWRRRLTETAGNPKN